MVAKPSPYAAPVQRNPWSFMAAVMVFADCRFSRSQPILDFVPFVVGIAKPMGSVTTRTLYGQLVFEGIGYSGSAALNLCEGCGHFFCYWTAARYPAICLRASLTICFEIATRSTPFDGGFVGRNKTVQQIGE
jgi:hypothetical protein